MTERGPLDTPDWLRERARLNLTLSRQETEDLAQEIDASRAEADALRQRVARLTETVNWFLAQERNEADGANDPLRSVFPATAARELESALAATPSDAEWLARLLADERERCAKERGA